MNKPESMHGLIRVPYASSHEGDGFTKYRLLTKTSPLPNRLNQIQGNGRIALVIRTRTGSRPSLRALQGCFRSRRTWRTQPGQCSIYLLRKYHCERGSWLGLLLINMIMNASSMFVLQNSEAPN